MCVIVQYIFSRVVREGFYNKMTFEQGHEKENERERVPWICRVALSRLRTSSCKGPEVKVHLASLRNSKDDGVSEVK